MENWEEQLIALRELSNELTRIERKRQQLKITGKTVSLKNQLDEIERKLKLPSHTVGDVKKHMRLLTELRLLYRTDEENSPLNVIKKETELINSLYDGLIKVYQNILAELT